MPTASETTIVRVSNVRPLFGSVKPTTSKSLKRPLPRARPRKRPTTDATRPITSASRMTERSTCRLEAPIVRRVANSRVRCAIVIESEFAITKAPTKSATPANASRNVCRKLMKLFVSSASLAAWRVRRSSPGCRAAGSARISATSCVRRDAALRTDADLVELARLVEEALGRREIEAGERGAADAWRPRRT